MGQIKDKISVLRKILADNGITADEVDVVGEAIWDLFVDDFDYMDLAEEVENDSAYQEMFDDLLNRMIETDGVLYTIRYLMDWDLSDYEIVRMGFDADDVDLMRREREEEE